VARKNVDLSRLNPLFRGPTLEQRETALGTMQMVPVGQIIPDPAQPRKEFDESSLKELTQSVLSYGVICPILVRPVEQGGVGQDGSKSGSEGSQAEEARYLIIAGERRHRAAKAAGLDAIPAVIDLGEDETAIRAKQLVENIQRESLNPMERAIAISQLRDRESWSIRELASQLGVSKALVQRSLEILALPEDLQLALGNGASESKILVLKKVEDKKTRAQFLKLVDQYTREQLEEAIEQLEGGDASKPYRGGTKAKTSKSSGRLSSNDTALVEELQKKLGIKVSLVRRASGQGRLHLDFYSEDDLKTLSAKLLGQ